MTTDTVIGICGRDFVMLSADTMKGHAFVFLKDDYVKIFPLTDKNVFTVVGDAGDSLQISSHISSHLNLYRIKYGQYPSAKSTAIYIRRTLTTFVRNHSEFLVSILMAGYDKNKGPDLYYLDSKGTSHSVRFTGIGLGAVLCNGLLQSEWKETLTRTEAYKLLKKCVIEIHKRLIINLRNFDVVIVDKYGIERLEPINFNTLQSREKMLAISNK